MYNKALFQFFENVALLLSVRPAQKEQTEEENMSKNSEKKIAIVEDSVMEADREWKGEEKDKWKMFD